jgi:hypothetical protein
MADSKDDLRLGDIQKDVNPADAELFPLNFGDMVKSLHSVDMKDLQDWFDLGQDIYRVVETNGRAAEAEVNAKNGTISEEEKSQLKEEQVEVDRNLFNKFVSKAAGFANVSLNNVKPMETHLLRKGSKQFRTNSPKHLMAGYPLIVDSPP